ncbi:MAG TPA: sterol desaturase family protein [Oligoflexus sp.]|uniref:sterol desaturase family protein n=1 Tax=Oligoflexus sp. TaxID=1971216 RepID=UPI002D80B03D|nr:sterol desaturase family protein [Oligoflexus sp.]HET9239316.1 sterol desaturase family protein [Oligoflexus sp.]
MKTSIYNKLAYIALYLAILCFLSVLAFHFPEYLSNPQLREVYDVEQLRMILLGSLYVSFGLGLIALLLGRKKGLALAAILMAALASILGGSAVTVEVPIQQKPIYLSLDLIILDLLVMSLIFVPLERIFYLRRQRFLREGLATDLSHYALNHLLMGGIFVLIVWPGNWIHQNIFLNRVPQLTQKMPIWLQVLAILFIADFAQYWIHRYFHTRKRWWQFHKIHHSTMKMDWLASSRLHIGDVIATRAFSYVPIVCLGFSQAAVQVYMPIVAIQALFVHSNVRFHFGPLRYILTTPLVHHWHHSSQPEALDKNFAVTFSIIDVVFGTFHCPRAWPEKYGLYQERISSSFVKQLVYPFVDQLRRSPKGENPK